MEKELTGRNYHNDNPCEGLPMDRYFEEKKNKRDLDLDKIRGCMIGGAAGDALGYEVEFWTENQIFGKYGPAGISNYELDVDSGKALISDDTQMTLFTANGLLTGETLAIAIYCSLRHQKDFSAGIIAAVNHNGDSDSTGAVTGNILGTWLGFDAIEENGKRTWSFLM